MVSHELRPFFGDVRTLGGRIARGRSFCFDGESEVHPIASWFWRGVPPRLGHAAVIGEPYLSIWPELRERVTCEEGLAFVTADSWRDGTDVADAIGGVPERLAIGHMPLKNTLFSTSGAATERYEGYPSVFPFPRPDA
jgi:hypothetical protein